MRLLALLVAVVVGFAFGFVIVTTNVLRPPAAADRLSGVHVRVASYSIDNLPNAGHRLHLQVAVTSLRDLDGSASGSRSTSRSPVGASTLSAGRA